MGVCVLPSVSTPDPQHAAARALGHLETLAALLACADPRRWDTMARPSAEGLGALLFHIHGELGQAFDALDAPGANGAS